MTRLAEFQRKFGTAIGVLSTRDLIEVAGQIDDRVAERTAEELKQGAQSIEVEDAHLLNSARLYHAIRVVLEREGAGAVTVACGDPAFVDYNATVCVPFSLLNSEGVPSSCDHDLPQLLTHMILMYLSGKPTYVGNLEMVDAGKDLIMLPHEAPALRVESFDEQLLSYRLANYHGFPFGPCFYVQPDCVGRQVTLARLNPAGDALLATHGTIRRTRETLVRRTTYDIEVPDARRYLHASADFGHHVVMVSGDYTGMLEGLGQVLGMDVRTIA
jgi:L-fucose isomerase-like protein